MFFGQAGRLLGGLGKQIGHGVQSLQKLKRPGGEEPGMGARILTGVGAGIQQAQQAQRQQQAMQMLGGGGMGAMGGGGLAGGGVDDNAYQQLKWRRPMDNGFGSSY